MRILFIMLLAACLAMPEQAWACHYSKKLPTQDKIDRAPVAFVGTVIEARRTADDKRQFLKFTVQEALHGAETGKIYEEEYSWTSCQDHFVIGERWLYLGVDLPAHSLLLEDHLGNMMQDHVEFAVLELGLKKAVQSLAQPANLKQLCGVGAYELKIGQGVWHLREGLFKGKSPEETEKTRAASEFFSELAKSWNMPETILKPAVMTVCDKGDADCENPRGTITFGTMSRGMISGRFSINDSEGQREGVFRASARLSPTCRDQ
jgi:hypothetical protein